MLPQLRALAVVLLVFHMSFSSGASVPAIDPPPNDNLANAIEVSGIPFQLATDLGAATREAFEPGSSFDGNHTAWWAWTAPSGGIYEWSAAADNTHLVSVTIFHQDAYGQLTQAAATYRRPAKDGGMLAPDQNGSFQAANGEHCLIRLDLTDNHLFPFDFVVQGPPSPQPVSVVFSKSTAVAPSNDLFANRASLTGSNAVFTVDLSAATGEPGEPEISTHAMHRTLWWTWAAPGYGSAVIRKRGALAPPAIGVYERGVFQSLKLVATSATEFGNGCYSDPGAHDFVEWNTTPGGRYEIQADRFPSSDTSMPAEFELAFTPAPANDIPQGAFVLAGTELSLVVSNTAATLRTDEPVIPAQSGFKSVWFRWTAPSRGILQVGSQAPIRYDDPGYAPDTTTGVVIIQPGLPCSGPFVDLHPPIPFAPVFGLYSQNGSQTDQSPFPNTRLAYGTNGLMSEVEAGRDYWIALDGDRGTSGQTPMNLLWIAPPSNDGFSNRVVLPSEAVRVQGRTFAATGEPSDPTYIANNNFLSRSAWWEWRAPAAGRWTLFVTKGQYDNKFVLYRGVLPKNGNEIGSTLNAPVVFACDAGETVEMGVFALAGFGGNVAFTLTPLAPPLPKLARYDDNWNWGYRDVILQVPDNSGLSYVLDRSDDLTLWTPVLTNANAWSHTLEFHSDLGKTNEFFRTRLVP